MNDLIPMHRLEFDPTAWEEIDSLLSNVTTLDWNPAEHGLPRAMWLAVAQMALGKAQLMEDGYYDSGDDDDDCLDDWSRQLRDIAYTITDHFRPGDGNI